MKSTASVSKRCGNGVGISLILLLVGFAALVNCESSFQRDISITKQQNRVLSRFKARVFPKITEDEMKEDLYLIRWLRVKDFNLDQAEEALLANIEWRRVNNMNNILMENWPKFEERYPYWIRGQDKEGKPLIFLELGAMNVREAIINGETDNLLRYIDSAMERAYRAIRHLQVTYRNVTQGILMLDLEGYNLVETGCAQCIPLILRAVQDYEFHYPGIAEKIIILNVPQSFEPLLAAARKVLSVFTNDALHIFGKNRREWGAFLGKHFDLDQLPTQVGGTDDGFEN